MDISINSAITASTSITLTHPVIPCSIQVTSDDIINLDISILGDSRETAISIDDDVDYEEEFEELANELELIPPSIEALLDPTTPPLAKRSVDYLGEISVNG